MIRVIVNPTAANGKGKETGENVHTFLSEKGIQHEMVYTEYSAHAVALAQKAAEDGIDTVISVGGDGTLTEIVRGLAGSTTTLGIIPAGTGNDFAKSAGVPSGWKEALEFALKQEAKAIDTGLCNDMPFINVFGTGFDVMTLDYAESAKKHVKGIWPYLYGVIRSVASFHPIPMHIEIGNDIILDGEYLLCAAGNGKYFGGGIPIAPEASIQDGVFDIVVVDAISRWRIPFYLPSLLKGTIADMRFAHVYRSDRCFIQCKNMRVEADGERTSMGRAELKIRPASLMVHC